MPQQLSGPVDVSQIRKTNKSLEMTSVQIEFITAMMIKKPGKSNCGKEESVVCFVAMGHDSS